MQVDILSLFPGYFQGPLDVSLLKRAREKGILDVRLIDIRDFAEGKHGKVDDRPYGGGPGMVLMPGPVCEAVRSVKRSESKVIFLSPRGAPLSPSICQRLSLCDHMILVCGHYEGIDQRAIDKEAEEEISIGDYVLTNGCSAALVLLDAVSRFIPGVIGNEEAAGNDSFQEGVLEGPQYTKPLCFEGLFVPEVLVSGHHGKIAKWRKEKGLEKTRKVRPDLFREAQGEETI